MLAILIDPSIVLKSTDGESDMTKAEQIFVSRMVPHIEAGLSFIEAAKAVLADDERIYLACQNKEIVSQLAAEVYEGCRK